jgi:hypothetical protein
MAITDFLAQPAGAPVEAADGISPATMAELLGAITRAAADGTLDDEDQSILDMYTVPQGLVRAPAVRAPRKAVVVTEADSLDAGMTKVVRPNGQEYHIRKWGEHDDVSVLRTARESNLFVLLYGAPGCGKTALVEAAFGNELHTVLGSGDTEVADLVGGYVQTPSGGFLWEDGPLLKAAEAGQPLLIDEIGLIDPKVLSIIYGLMDGRREYNVTQNPERGTVRAKEGFYVVAATNPNAPGVRLSEAILSRFTLQVEMTTDWSLARKLSVPTQMVTVAQNLSKKQQSHECSWAPQMRELLAFRDISTKFGTKFAISNLLAAAPEMDRPIVADVVTRAYGEAFVPAKI